jgi:hypothetical protein
MAGGQVSGLCLMHAIGAMRLRMGRMWVSFMVREYVWLDV